MKLSGFHLDWCWILRLSRCCTAGKRLLLLFMKGAEVVWLEPNCQTEQKGCYCCGRSPSHHGCMTPPSFCNGMVLLVFWLPTLSDLLLPSRFSIPCCFKWWKRRFFFFFKKKNYGEWWSKGCLSAGVQWGRNHERKKAAAGGFGWEGL